ncbi:putative sugar O-methyltransferase [bacterium]|nr:putative sugar O-methyltransferase [bacterium]
MEKVTFNRIINNYRVLIDDYHKYNVSKFWIYQNKLKKVLEINEDDLVSFRSNILSKTLDPGNSYLIDEETESKKILETFDNLVKKDGDLGCFSETGIGEPYTTKIHGIDMNRSSIMNGFFYKKIKKYVENGSSIMEIGGGYGGLSSLFVQNYNINYYMYDLPEAILMQTYFLSKVVPNKKLCLVDNYSDCKDELDSMHLLTPNYIKDLNNSSIDLFMNFFSMQEMDIKTVNLYLSEVGRVIKDNGIVVLANRLKKVSNLSDYNIPDSFDVVEFSSLDVHIFPKLTFFLILKKKTQKDNKLSAKKILSQFNPNSKISRLFGRIKLYLKAVLRKFFHIKL